MKLSAQIAAMIVALIGEAKAIMDAAVKLQRELTADEAKAIEERHLKCAELRKQKALAERQEAEEAGLDLPQPRIVKDLSPGVDLTQQLPSAQGKEFKPKIYGRPRFAANAMEAYRFGAWAAAALGHSKAGLYPWAQKLAKNLDIFDPKALLNEGTNTAGGYLVPDEFMNTIITIMEKMGVFRRKARIVPMTRDTASRPRRTGGLTAYPVGEGSAGTESNKTWDRVSLTADKWMVLTRWSKELDEDAVVSIGDDLIGEIAYAFATAEDDAGFNGDGTSTYAGIVGLKNALNSSAQQAQGTSNTWSAMVLGDFNILMSLLPDFVSAMAPEFYCNKAFYHAVMARVAMATGGTDAIEVVNGIPQGKFFGYPVNFVSKMPNATATSGIMCYFGDLAATADFGDRRQITISTSEEASIGGQSMFERDEIGIKGTERFDINVHETGSAVTNRTLVALKTS